jgi:hypothetical protein
MGSGVSENAAASRSFTPAEPLDFLAAVRPVVIAVRSIQIRSSRWHFSARMHLQPVCNSRIGTFDSRISFIISSAACETHRANFRERVMNATSCSIRLNSTSRVDSESRGDSRTSDSPGILHDGASGNI